jgi:hypothetical protein
MKMTEQQQWDVDRKNPPTATSANPFSDRIQMKPIGGMAFMRKVQSQPPPQSDSSRLGIVPTQLNTEERNICDSQKSRHRELQEQITFLVEKVQQLSNELQTTRQSHQLASDQSRAEIAMLQSELKNQRIRHEEIVSTLRKRLVESEMTRSKMQEQMMQIVEVQNKKETAVNSRWNEMILKVNEDAKWVDEQMACWKESLEEHEKRMEGAKARGEMNAELPMGSAVKSDGGQDIRSEDTAAERRRQRRAMLGLDEEFSDD